MAVPRHRGGKVLRCCEIDTDDGTEMLLANRLKNSEA